MFEPPREERHLPSWLLKLLTISACVLGIGWGLCGIDAHLHPNADFGSMGILTLLGFALMVLAALALGLVVLILLVSLVTLIFPR